MKWEPDPIKRMYLREKEAREFLQATCATIAGMKGGPGLAVMMRKECEETSS